MKPWVKITLLILLVLAVGAGSFFAGSQYTKLQLENQKLKEQGASTTPTPTTQQEVTPTPTTQVTPTGSTRGRIQGTLGYPSEHIPPMSIYAFNTADSTRFFFTTTSDNQGSFMIENVEPGTYHVVGYAASSNSSGAWSRMVPCGLSVNCTDHSLIPVTVTAGATATGVEVKDWYAPVGTFPPKPN